MTMGPRFGGPRCGFQALGRWASTSPAIPSRSTSDRDAATPPAYAGKGGSNGTPVVSGGVCATFRTMDSMVK